MHKKLKLIFLLIILPSFQSHGQINELSLMGIDTDDFTQAYKPETDGKDRESEKPKKEINEEAQREKFKDSNYGYSGGESFNNPPRSNLSEEALEYFGYSYFLNGPDAFFSQANVPVSPNYLIGPDDTVNVILYGNKNKTYELKVSRDGNIFFPEIGPLSVAGLSFGDMQNLIKTTIASQLIGTQVSLTLGSLRTIDVFILGAANKPGMYSISALSNITNAIFESGGVDTSGSLRDIKLKRNGETIVHFDLYDLFLNGDTSNDSRLMHGDVIFIEPIGKTAGVRGEVNRPSIYELKDDETLEQLLRFAGSMKPKASRSNADLTRINQTRNSFELIKLDLESSEKVNLNNGDIVNVYSVNDKVKNAVLLTGHAAQSGFYPWKENMKILDLFRNSDDFLEMTDLNYVLIKRKNKSNQKYFFRQADIEEALKDPSSSENIRLFDQDEILLLPSLLSPTLITTTLIKNQSSNDQEIESSVTEEEWTSLTYLRKSLKDQGKEEIDDKDAIIDSGYYEYSIYNYCNLPRTLVLQLIDEDENLDLTKEITQECRKQLLDPMLSIAKKDNSSDKLSTINVFGGVHHPGVYPYTKEMSLLDAIKASGGALDGIYGSEVELIRRDNVGNRFVSKDSYASLSEADNIDLSKMDVITVKKLISSIRTVTISGEVHFPGVYPISEDQTLSELMVRAGGATNSSDLNAAVFLREELREAEIKRIKAASDQLQRKLILSSQATDVGEDALGSDQMAQIASLLETAEDAESLGRLVIDLEQIISAPSEDLELKDGDSLYIPKQQQTVSVIGEVFVPNNHIYDSEISLSEYIKLSGGYTEFADESSLYVIKSDGSILSPSDISSGFFRRNNNIEPGDTLVVPLQVDSFSSLKAATEITQIIYQMAIAAAAVNSF